MRRTRRRPHFTHVVVAVLGVVTLPLAGVLAAAPAMANATPVRAMLAGTRPAWASTSADAGAVPTDLVQSVRVYLAGIDPGGLAAYAVDVSTPGDADYQHYLTPRQYQARFGPSSAQISAVESWLTGAKLHVTTANQHYVAASGSGSDIEAAFGTTLHRYRTSTGIEQAPSSTVSVPATLASDVLTVSGLTTSTAAMTSDVQFDATDATGGSGPPSANVGACSDYYGQKQAAQLPPAYGSTLNWDMCGYTPAQLRSAYGVARSGLSGRGVTIAVVDEGDAPTLEADLDTYSKDNGLPQLRRGQFGENQPPDITTSCPAEPATEASLDVEAVHTMAPGANLLYVGADCTCRTTPWTRRPGSSTAIWPRSSATPGTWASSGNCPRS